MKSNKQKRREIKAKRLERTEKLKKSLQCADGSDPRKLPGLVAADKSALAHNNTYGLLPDFYWDMAFTCRDCGSEEVWTAKQQKWWYEIAKGNINSTAVRCRSCRNKVRSKKTHLNSLMQQTNK
jgi:transcription elongation factor Elf1